MSSDLISDLRNPDVAAGTSAMVMRRQAAAEIERLQAALAIYGDPKKWDPDMHQGQGNYFRAIDAFEWRVAKSVLEG